jgi:O-antigen/teichoic acid export membrane protein
MPMTTGNEANPLSLRSVRRRLLAGSAWVLGAKVATLIVGIGVQSMLAHLLTQSQFGIYTTAFTMALLGAAMAQLGLDRAVVRFVAGSIGLGELGRARVAMRTALVYGTVSAVVAGMILATGLGQFLADNLFHKPALALAIPFTAGWLIALAVQSLMVESFRGMSRFAAATLLDELFVDFVALIVFATLFVTVGHAGATPMPSDGRLGLSGPNIVIGVWTGATALAVAVGLTMLLRRYRSLVGTGDLPRREMFQTAWPLGVTNVAILLLGSAVDVLVLSSFAPADTVGLYGASARLVIFVATPFVVFSGVIPPIIAELHAQQKMRQLERALRAGATLAGLPAFGVLLIFLLFGPWILGTIFTEPYRAGAPILAILSLGRLYAIWAGSAGVTLMMTGYQKAMMKLTLGCGLLSVSLGLGVAYTLKANDVAPTDIAIGVACATALSLVIQNTLQLVLVRRWLGIWTMIHFSPRELFRYLRPKGEKGTAMEDAAEQAAEALVGPDEAIGAGEIPDDADEDPPGVR